MSLAQIMGALIFIAGLVLVIVAVLSIIVKVGTIGEVERFILFFIGTVTLCLGYYMANMQGAGRD